MTCFVVPEDVSIALRPDGHLVVLNVSTEQYHLLNGTCAEIYQMLVRATAIEDVVDYLAERYHHTPPDRIRADVERVIVELVHRRLLEQTGSYTRNPAAVLMVAPAPGDTVPVDRRVLAVIAFVLALVLLRLPFRKSTSAVATLKRRLAKRDATVKEAGDRLATARLMTRYYPGRVACLELSLTAVLSAALLGQRIDWCFGFAMDPQRFHAWIEVAGTPVTEPTDDPIGPTYRCVVRV